MGFLLGETLKALQFPKWLFVFCSFCFWFVCALRMRTPRFFIVNYKVQQIHSQAFFPSKYPLQH